MTLQASGSIALSQVRSELSASGTMALGSTNVRSLASKASGVIKLSDLYSKSAIPVFVSGPSMVSPHPDTPGGCGTKTAALCVAGSNNNVVSETFNGTAWTSATGYPVAVAGIRTVGSVSASLSLGGSNINNRQAACRTFNGTAWTTTGAMVGDRAWHSSGGTPTDCIAAAGASNASNTLSTSEKFNGTAWSSTSATTIFCQLTCGFGNSSSGVLKTGGYNWAVLADCEAFNGSSWSAAASLPLTMGYVSSCGSNTSGLVAGGSGDLSTGRTNTASFNGTTWSAGSSLVAARHKNASVGSPQSAAVFGGSLYYSTELL